MVKGTALAAEQEHSPRTRREAECTPGPLGGVWGSVPVQRELLLRA